ncbi:MAG: hypothetical protein AB7E32_13700 [Desulfovibrio sp.]
MTLPITQLGSLSGAPPATTLSSARASGRDTTTEKAENPAAALLNGSADSSKPTLHVRAQESNELTKIHVSRVFTRAALRDAFDRATNVALSMFTELGDDGKRASRLLRGNDSEQFFSVDSPEQKELLGKVQTALDEGRFDDARDLFKDSVDLFNKDNTERFQALAKRAGQEFEASLKHSLGHVRMNYGGDFTAMMTEVAEDGGKRVEEALRSAFFAGGDGLAALTRAVGEGADTLLSTEWRNSYTTEGRAALLREKETKAATVKVSDADGQGADEDEDEDAPTISGDLLADIASYVKRNTLEDSETMAALKYAAGQVAGRAEDALKDKIGVHRLHIEYDLWLETPEKRGKGASVIDTLVANLKEESDLRNAAKTGEATGDAIDNAIESADGNAAMQYQDLQGLISQDGFEALFVARKPGSDAPGRVSMQYTGSASGTGSGTISGSASVLSGMLRNLLV